MTLEVISVCHHCVHCHIYFQYLCNVTEDEYQLREMAVMDFFRSVS